MTIVKDIYNSIFGKNYEAVWRQFSTENNGTYIVGKHDNLDSVEINYSNHKIVFDQYIHYQVVGGTSYETEYTRVRLEFKSNDNLQLRLTKQAFVDNIGKLFGAQDIQIGDKTFDKRFMIKGNDEFKIQTLFSNEIIKGLILEQSDIHLQILDKEGIFDEPIQDGNVMLYYISETVVKEIAQLNSLLKLYTSLVDQLTKLSSVKPLKASS
jgi:hypothetical protein